MRRPFPFPRKRRCSAPSSCHREGATAGETPPPSKGGCKRTRERIAINFDHGLGDPPGMVPAEGELPRPLAPGRPLRPPRDRRRQIVLQRVGTRGNQRQLAAIAGGTNRKSSSRM